MTSVTHSSAPIANATCVNAVGMSMPLVKTIVAVRGIIRARILGAEDGLRDGRETVARYLRPRPKSVPRSAALRSRTSGSPGRFPRADTACDAPAGRDERQGAPRSTQARIRFLFSSCATCSSPWGDRSVSGDCAGFRRTRGGRAGNSRVVASDRRRFPTRNDRGPFHVGAVRDPVSRHDVRQARSGRRRDDSPGQRPARAPERKGGPLEHDWDGKLPAVDPMAQLTEDAMVGVFTWLNGR
jgi:hypothetical protein